MNEVKDRNIIKSFFQFSAGPWISAIISFFTTPIITWLIIPEEFGKASMYTVAFSLIMQISLLGTDQSFVRMFYEYEEKKRPTLLWNSLITSFGLSIVISFILLIFRSEVSHLLFGDPKYLLPVLLLVITIILGILERFASLVLRMKKRGLAFSSLRIINASANAGGVILYAFLFGRNFYAIIFGKVIGLALTLVVSVLLELDFWRKGFYLSKSLTKKIVLYGLPFVPTFIIAWLFNSMDKLALRSFSSFEEIGFYTAGNKIVSILMLIQAGFSTFWTPVAYENYENTPEDSSLYSKVSKLLAALMFSVALLVIAFKDLIILLLAKAYLPAANIMPFLVFNPIMYTVSETTVVGINFKKKTHWHLWISVLAAGTNFVGNTLLVPIYGAKGAAISTGLSYIVFFYARTLISKKLYPVDYNLKRFTAGVLTLLFVAFLNTFGENTAIEVGSAVLGFSIVLILYHKEIKYIFGLAKQIIHSIRNRNTSRTEQ